MPATAAYAIHKLTDIPFSMGAHAYDLFRKGGDWILPLKLKTASFIRTSSISSASRLQSLEVHEDKIKVIRRGLDCFTQRENFDLCHSPVKLRMIAVGRLVPKKRIFPNASDCFRVKKTPDSI